MTMVLTVSEAGLIQLRLAGGDAIEAVAEDVSGIGLNAVKFVPIASGLPSFPTQTTIELNQEGTLAAPAAEQPITIKPLNSTRAPFTFNLISTIFNGVEDTALFWGYNPVNIKPLEPVAYWAIETHFSPLLGQTQNEVYLELATQSSPLTNFIRPVSFVQDLTSGAVTSSVSYQNGTATGSFSILGGNNGQVTQCTFTDGRMNILPAAYVIEVTNGSLQVSLKTTFTMIASGVGGTSFIAADLLNLADHSFATTLASFDMHTTPGACSFIPGTDATGTVGTNVFRWNLIRGVTITSGDLDLVDEAHGAHWTLREEKDCILAVNRETDEWYKLPLIPLTPEERKRYAARPLSDATKGVKPSELIPPMPMPKRRPKPTEETLS